MTRHDLRELVDSATPETLPDLIRDLEAAKARALARVATWAAMPRNPDVEPVTAPQMTVILEEIAKTARVRRPRYVPDSDPVTDLEADHVPSAAGMFTCMVTFALMLVVWVGVFYVACWR